MTSTRPAPALVEAALITERLEVETGVQEFRRELLSLPLPDLGLTVNDAWALLNAHVRKASAGSQAVGETLQAADVSLALWRTGFEYIVTEAGWPCPHEGWLFLANSDLGALNYPQLREWHGTFNTVLTRMLDD